MPISFRAFITGAALAATGCVSGETTAAPGTKVVLGTMDEKSIAECRIVSEFSRKWRLEMNRVDSIMRDSVKVATEQLKSLPDGRKSELNRLSLDLLDLEKRAALAPSSAADASVPRPAGITAESGEPKVLAIAAVGPDGKFSFGLRAPGRLFVAISSDLGTPQWRQVRGSLFRHAVLVEQKLRDSAPTCPPSLADG